MRTIKLVMLVYFALGLNSIQAAVAVNAPAKIQVVKESRKLIVYYFHNSYRCPSCRKIEAFTAEAVNANFEKELKAGRMEYSVVNVDEKGNEHFTQDYQLYTKSVVIADTKNGKDTRWKNLPKVWELLSNKEKFQSYIRDEIKNYLKGVLRLVTNCHRCYLVILLRVISMLMKLDFIF